MFATPLPTAPSTATSTWAARSAFCCWLNATTSTDAVKEALHDTCLQIAAASPVAPEYVTRDQVKAEHLAHETEILAAQARNEGKPEKIIEKMVQGRINKFYEEVCLLEQIYVKDGETRVGAMIEKRAPGTKIVALHPLQDGRRSREESLRPRGGSCRADREEVILKTKRNV